MTISDEVFKQELDTLLKRQGLKKSKRIICINFSLSEPLEERNYILEHAERIARKKELQKKQSKKIKSEFEEQCDFVEWFKRTYPDIVIISIRNHGSRTPRERVDQIREGLHSGAADLYIPKWHLWIEFKKSKGGLLSEKQKNFSNYVLNECGDSWFLAEGCEDGKKKIINFIDSA